MKALVAGSAALTTLAVTGVAVGAAGVALGTVIQHRFEAKPTAAETRALERINAPQTVRVMDHRRGPNRADLGGGR